MPKYDEIINQSAENLKSLGNQLKELDKLNQSIEDLKNESAKIQHEFREKFKEIATLSSKYTELLGEATSTYLDENNTLFTSKINEFSDKNADLKNEISRLENVDLVGLFNKLQVLFLEETRQNFEIEFKKIDTKTEVFQSKINDFGEEITRIENVDLEESFNTLQKVFINQTREDLELELKKIDAKTNDFQGKINELKAETNRLKKIDLEAHFEKHQKKLVDIFNAINNVNLTLTGITNALNTINQTLGQTQQSLSTFKETIENRLSEQDKNIEDVSNNLKAEIEKLTNQNNALQKAGKMDRIILTTGIVVIIVILIFILIK